MKPSQSQFWARVSSPQTVKEFRPLSTTRGKFGWKSYFVSPSTPEQVKALHNMVPLFDLDFLSHAIVGRKGVVLVRPEHQAAFTATLNDEGISYRIHADNVKSQLDIDDQLIEEQEMESMNRNGQRLHFYNYQPMKVIDKYKLDDIAKQYPNITTLVSPANSFEGHPIKYLKISNTNFTDDSKPVIVIDAGIHAREWIAPSVVTYVIHKLVEDLTESDLIRDFDWILLPVVNPDGYKYSFERNRFWVKTRSTNHGVTSTVCPGVDGNRNFDFFWGTVGTSSDPCSDIFGGSSAFSEIETRVVRDIFHTHLNRITLYITMHSYGSMILYPWSHNGTLSLNGLALHTVGITMADAIHEKALPHFPRHVVGNSLQVTGNAGSGASEDYAHSYGIPLTYAFELPGLAPGIYGFHLDPRYIRKVCEETWAAVVVGARRSNELFGNRRQRK